MELWNEINFILSEKVRPGTSEANYEKHIIEALRLLGWSEFRGEVKVRPSFNIGAASRITPDIVVRSEEKNIFLVEVKQPDLPFNSRYLDQTKSYLRCLKLEFGIIVGKKIWLLYDGYLSNNEPVLFREIEFQQDNSKGQEFSQLFSKSTFDPAKIESLVQKRILEKRDQKQVRILEKQLLTKDYEIEIKDLLKKQLQEKFSDTVIEKALKDLKITVSDTKVSAHPERQKTKTYKDPSHLRSFSESTTGNRDMPIGKYVRTTFREVLNKIDRTELYNLQKEDYSINTFHIRYPFLRKARISDVGRPHRYWKDPVHILGDNYYMCSEWFEVPQNNDRPYYETWLRRMRNL